MQPADPPPRQLTWGSLPPSAQALELPKKTPHLAVVLPCFNEELSIASTIIEFQKALPFAVIYVIDNASTDNTRQIASLAGANVRYEGRQGKGNAVRRAFSDIDADIYVLADGDGTYHAADSRKMVELLIDQELDMVTGDRVHTDPQAYRPGHVLGNRIFSRFVAHLFGTGIDDLFSGYRVFSRRFVKSFPSLAEGFEIESEMSIHALQLRMPLANLKTRYSKRNNGSVSKLNTFRDGLKILGYIIKLKRLYQPRQFFGFGGVLCVAMAIALGIPILVTFLEIGQVPRFPTAILASGLFLLGALIWFSGVVLESSSQLSLEMKLLQYLRMPTPRFTKWAAPHGMNEFHDDSTPPSE